MPALTHETAFFKRSFYAEETIHATEAAAISDP
jgi:hypothetical protein